MVLLRKLKSFIRILKNDGVRGAFQALNSKIVKFFNVRVSKKMRLAWESRNGFVISPFAFRMTKRKYEMQRRMFFPQKIKFSIIVPLYNTPKDFLQEMIGSVLFQAYSNWELCLADGSDSDHGFVGETCKEIAKTDSRIKYKKLEGNYGISGNTNECMKMATGDYISLFDHDDILHPSALYETAKAINKKNAELVYTDEAIFESPNLHSVRHVALKADFSQGLLEKCNYVCHFTSFKKSIYEGLMFDSECDGAQDYDIILKLTERTKKISHIKKCLYYWRASASSTAGSSDAKPYTWEAGKRALEKHFERIGENVRVCFGNNPNTYLCLGDSMRKVSARKYIKNRIESVF